MFTQDRLVGCFLGQRMAKHVFGFGIPGYLVNKLRLLQRRQVAVKLTVRTAGNLPKNSIKERASDQYRQLQRPASFLIQPVNTAHNQRL